MTARSTPDAEPRPLDVTVLLMRGSFLSTAIAPIEIFHSAGVLWNQMHGEPERPRFRVRAATLDGQPVAGVDGLTLAPGHGLDDLGRADLVVLSAAGWDAFEGKAADPRLIAWLRAAHARGTLLAAVCSGVAVLAEAGLLDGRRATTHWAGCDALRGLYPGVLWEPESFVTEDRGLFCSGGVYAAIDLSLYLVERLCGHETALRTARALLLSLPRSAQAGYAVVPLSRPHTDDLVKRAEAYLQRNFDRPVSTESLAREVGMSPRTLIRRFKSATGQLPGAYLQALRIAAAREMLERDSAPVQSVATGIGYDDVAFFRGLFKRHTGMTPAEYRSRFGRTAIDRGALAPMPAGR